MKKLFRGSLSVILTLTVLFSTTAVSVTVVDSVTKDKVATAQSTATKYSLDDICTDMLFPKTEKSSECENDGEIEKKTTNACSDDVYKAFNLSNVSAGNESSSGSSESMGEQSKDIVNDSKSDNPLAGYTFVSPKELVIGQINRNEQHVGEIRAVDNVSEQISNLNIDSLSTAGSPISLTEEKQGQTHNTIGIDYNGDGVDELAYFSLYADSNGHASVRTYKRTNSDSLSWEQVSDKNMQISTDNEILDIEAQQSKGYTAMTAGDFDNDGKEELACYFPCANNSSNKNESDEPFVGVIDIDDEGYFSLSDMKKIYLSSIRSEFKDLKKGGDYFESWYMPIVALSTTSIRANGGDVNSKSYDDLVINVSVPRVYHDDDVSMNSCVAIYSYENGSYNRKFNEDLRYDKTRMLSTNSVDADLNADGYKELVVAGLCETDLKESNDKSTGKISTSENLVHLIYWDGSSYKFVWSSPKTVEGAGNVKVDFDQQEPIAITAGRYDPNSPQTMDYLCIQGVVLSCQGSQVYAVKEYDTVDDSSGSNKTQAVVTTMPYHEYELFTSAHFDVEYKVDIDSLVSADDSPFISTADSGLFCVSEGTETIALLTGDQVKVPTDNISYDIILISCDAYGKWKAVAHDDYIHHKNEDDEGTFMSLCFADCDLDQTYYKYLSKEVGYSSPTLYSVVQVPPYYEEVNGATVSFTVTHSNSSAVKGDWGVGGGAGFSYESKKLEVDAIPVVKYVGSTTSENETETATTLTLHTDQDYAVSLVVPVVVCNYDVWTPNGNKGDENHSTMQTVQYLKPTFAALSIDEYNKAASALTDEEDKKAAPIIDSLPKSRAGDPYGYNATLDDLKPEMSIGDSVKVDSTLAKSTVTSGAESFGNDITVTKSSELENGFNISLDIDIKANFKFLRFVKFRIDLEGGASWVSSDSDGVTFRVDYEGIEEENTGSINSESSKSYTDYRDSQGNLIKSSITHFTPEDYQYTANAVAYPSDFLNPDGKAKTEGTEYNFNKVYLLSYYTDGLVGTPPVLPEYFGVQSVRKNSDGTHSITLAWNCTNATPEENWRKQRSTDAYNIYVKSLNAEKLMLVNNEGPIFLDKKTDIMTYEVGGLKDTSMDYVFYIAPANTSVKTAEEVVDGINVYEGILSDPVKVNIDTLYNTDGVIITQQPENYYLKSVGETATFNIDAVDVFDNKDDLIFQWQTYDVKAKVWCDVTNNTSTEPTIYQFVTTEESVDMPIRCLVTKNVSSAENYTATSDSVTVLIGEAPVKPQDEFDEDEDGNLIIRTYDDLVTMANVVRSDYKTYGSEKYILANNIVAPDDKFWTRGIGSVSENKPFNGKFDGQGYCIIGLNVNSSQYGGLFEFIGEKGSIKDLFVFDCDFSSSSKTAGGIAAVNKGTIDHCTSGVNITSGYIYPNGNKYYAPEFNSSIKGEISGGIVGENSGSLTGCRSSAVVSGTMCGGIAGVNTGKIYGCANNGKVGNSKAELSGGLAGKNGGTLEASYNSASVENSEKTSEKSSSQKGSVAGINGYDGLIPTVKNVYYIIKDKDGLSAIGTDSTESLDNTNIGESDIEYLQSLEFTNTLNGITDESVSWKHNPPLNKGYPIIEGNFFIDSIKPAGNDITVQGSMHKALKISYDIGSENSEEYELLSSGNGKNKILKTYSVSLTDKDGNYIPAELWCTGSYKISVPVDRENIKLAGINTEGNIVYYKPDSVKDGMAVFTVSHPMSFAIVETNSEKVVPPNNDYEGSINTGETSFNFVILLVAILALVVIFGTKRRKKVG